MCQAVLGGMDYEQRPRNAVRAVDGRLLHRRQWVAPRNRARCQRLAQSDALQLMRQSPRANFCRQIVEVLFEFRISSEVVTKVCSRVAGNSVNGLLDWHAGDG